MKFSEKQSWNSHEQVINNNELIINAHKEGGGRLKMGPPSKIIIKLINKNTIKVFKKQKFNPPPKFSTTPIYPLSKKLASPHEPSP